MTSIIGHDGSVILGTHGTDALVRTWRLDFAKTVVEVTGFGDVNLRRNRGGNLAISGSCVASMDDGAAGAPNPDGIVAGGESSTFLASTGNSYAFTALMSNVRIESDKNGQAVATYDVVNGDSDTLTEAWT